MTTATNRLVWQTRYLCTEDRVWFSSTPLLLSTFIERHASSKRVYDTTATVLYDSLSFYLSSLELVKGRCLPTSRSSVGAHNLKHHPFLRVVHDTHHHSYVVSDLQMQ